MDPNFLVEALRGTIDPNLREAAEKQLNEVKLRLASDCVGACGAVWDRASLGHNIKMVPSRVPSYAPVSLTRSTMQLWARREHL